MLQVACSTLGAGDQVNSVAVPGSVAAAPASSRCQAGGGVPTSYRRSSCLGRMNTPLLSWGSWFE